MTAVAGFARRLAYVRWLRSIGRRPETDRELAAAWGVGEKWLAKWKNSERPPEGRSEALAIEAALEPVGVPISWLYDEKGEPPLPDLWEIWCAAGEQVLPAGAKLETAQPMPRSSTAKKKKLG